MSFTVPKEPIENMRFRRFINIQCKVSPAKRAAVLERCSKDILFTINTFFYTYDPRLKGNKTVPFITYPYQDRGFLELQEAIDIGDDEVIQKSRVMGASWMLVSLFISNCLFRKGNKFLMMSRNAELVDSDDSDSLFWKLDFIHKYLPPWMLDYKDPAHLKRTVMKVIYIRTDCQITGATTTKASGIGGRATAAGIDEYSRYDPVVAKLLKAGLRPVTNCCLWNFTPNPEMGKSHPSYELVEQAARGDIRSLRMHWREHPVYTKGLYRVPRATRKVEIIDQSYDFGPSYPFQLDGVFEWHSPWFDKERKRVGNDRDMKELYEIDYEGSGYTFFDEMIITAYMNELARSPRFEGDMSYDDKGKPLSFVHQSGGQMKFWCDLKNGKASPVAYAAGVDISLGTGKTPSVLSIAEVETGVKVFEVATAVMKPDEFAVLVVAVCRWFSSFHHQTYLAWEHRGPGITFAETVLRLGYTAVYTPPASESKWSKKPGETPGFSPNSHNKRSLLLQYQTALANRDFINPSLEALKECFEWMNTPKGPKSRQTMNKSDDPSGAEENHGDRVIADALCYKMIVVKGGGTAKSKPVIVAEPGSFAWYEEELERKKKNEGVMYADWNRRR